MEFSPIFSFLSLPPIPLAEPAWATTVATQPLSSVNPSSLHFFSPFLLWFSILAFSLSRAMRSILARSPRQLVAQHWHPTHERCGSWRHIAALALAIAQPLSHPLPRVLVTCALAVGRPCHTESITEPLHPFPHL